MSVQASASRRSAAGRTAARRGHIVSRRRSVVAAALLAATVATNLFDLLVDDLGDGLRLLDANWEFSWSHNLDTAMLAAGVVAAVIGAFRVAGAAVPWRVTAVILSLLFLDEASPLHAQIGELRFGKLLYVPLLLGLVSALWRLASETNERPAVLVGLVTLLLSFAMHVDGVPALRPLGYFTVLYQAAVGVKEGRLLAVLDG